MNSRYGGLQQRMESERLRLANEQGANRMALMAADRQARLAHMARQVEEQEREMAATQQQAQITAQAMHNETEQADEANRAMSFEAATQLKNEYQKLSPMERYEQIASFEDRAREMFELNPNEHTQRNFLGFAGQKIRAELSGYKPKLSGPKPESKAGRFSGIKYNGKYQITDENGDWIDAPEGWEPPEPQPRAMPEKKEPLGFQDNISRLQAMRRKYQDYPELVEPIERELQKEFDRPQYWASTHDAIYSSLPADAQAILDKGKEGRPVSELEQTIVKTRVEAALKNQTNRRNEPIIPTDIIRSHLTDTPEQQQLNILAYPQLARLGQSAATQAGPSPVITKEISDEGSTETPAPPDPAELARKAQDEYYAQPAEFRNSPQGKLAKTAMMELEAARKAWRQKQIKEAEENAKPKTEDELRTEYEKLFSPLYRKLAKIPLFKNKREETPDYYQLKESRGKWPGWGAPEAPKSPSAPKKADLKTLLTRGGS